MKPDTHQRRTISSVGSRCRGTMPLRYALLTVLASTACASIATAGCGFTFVFLILDNTGAVVTSLPPDDVQQWDDTYEVQLLPGQSFQATVHFNSCCGGNTSLTHDGQMIQEWSAVNTWTTDEPGYFTWTFEGNCNMAPPPMTRYFQISGGAATALGLELIGHDFILRSLVVADDARHAYVDCSSDQATDLQIEILSVDGRLQHASFHRILPGENRVPVELPSSASTLAVFRLTTREGVMHTRKVVL